MTTLHPLRLLALLSVTALATAGLACSRDDQLCPNGLWPFDGQTAVALDALLEIDHGEPLPRDLPDLKSGIHLEDKAGRVPFDIDVDAANGIVTVIPRQPLEPDRRYWLSAISWYQIEQANPAWWAAGEFGRDDFQATFTTEQTPELLTVEADGDVWILAFSEPMELDTLEGRVLVDHGAGPRALQVHGLHKGHEHLIVVDRDGHETAENLILADGVFSQSGFEVHPSESIDTDSGDTVDVRFATGRPHCRVGY